MKRKASVSRSLQIEKLEQLLAQGQLFEIPFDELRKNYSILTMVRKPSVGVVDAYLANLLTQYRRVRRHYFETLPLEEVLFFPKIQHTFYAILMEDYYKKQQPVLDEPIRPYNYGESPDFFRSKQIPKVRNYFVTELHAREIDKFPEKIFRSFEDRILYTLKECSGCIERYIHATETNSAIILLKDSLTTQKQDEAIIALQKLNEQHN